MENFKKSMLFLTLIGSSFVYLNAADKVYLEKSSTHELKINNQSNIVENKKFNSTLGFSNEITLTKRKTLKTKDGKVVTRYIQNYKNIPVIGEEIIISENPNDHTQRAFGSALYGISNDITDTKVKMTEKDALIKGKEIFSKKFAKLKKSVFPAMYKNEGSTLKIWQNKKGVATLIYEVQFTYEGDTPSMPHYYIDAKTGVVLYHYDNLMHADATGVGGNLKTGIYEYGTDYNSLNVTTDGGNCIMNNPKVLTMDLNHSTDYISLPVDPFTFTCPGNTYQAINGAYSPINDAHYFGEVVYDMYQNWMGIPPLDFQLVMQVHFDSNYENAFWDGARMTFGDGASTFYPLVSLDVTSHEVSHGFTQQNSNLIYSGKSGGLNESFSDIAGEAAEYYSRGSNDWLVGSEIFKSGVALRYMEHPSDDGISIEHQDQYVNGMDVHYSSGVYNRAFYLLATTSGWNTQKAFEVYANANQSYWASGTDWNNAGAGVLNAATDLGYNLTDVCISLNTVGVYPAVPSCPLVGPAVLPAYTILDITDTLTVDSPDAIHRTGSYAQYHSFQILKTTKVTIDLTSADFDTYLFLLNSSNDVIDSNDDALETLNSQLVLTLEPGTYIVEATTYWGGDTGTFRLEVVGEDNKPFTIVPIITYLLD